MTFVIGYSRASMDTSSLTNSLLNEAEAVAVPVSYVQFPRSPTLINRSGVNRNTFGNKLHVEKVDVFHHEVGHGSRNPIARK